MIPTAATDIAMRLGAGGVLEHPPAAAYPEPTAWAAVGGTATYAASTAADPCDIFTAFANAAPGDLVYIIGGTHTVTQSTYPPAYQAILHPAASGVDPANPTVFMGDPNAATRPQLVLDVPEDYMESPVKLIGTGGYNNIKLANLSLRTTNGMSPGIMFGREADTSGLYVEDIDIVCGSLGVYTLDNRDVVRVENARSGHIKRLKISGFSSTNETDHPQNNGNIKVYDSSDITISNCEIFGGPSGISMKRDCDRILIENNWIHGCYQAIWNEVLEYTGTTTYFDSDDNVIRNNLFTDYKYAGVNQAGDGKRFARNLEISHNTFVPASTAAFAIGTDGATNAIQRDNVFAGSGNGSRIQHKHQTTLAAADHNLYEAFSLELRRYDTNATLYADLPTWQNSGELVGGGNPGSGSLVAAPQFVNPDGSSAVGYALASTSPGKGAASDGADIGANTATIGAI